MGGAAPGSMHDLTMARHSSIIQSLATANERALADKGYIGEDVFITPIRNAQEHQQIAFNQVITSYREIVEHAIGRLKLFHAISDIWRQHDIFWHPFVFIFLIYQLTNIEMHHYHHPLLVQ